MSTQDTSLRNVRVSETTNNKGNIDEGNTLNEISSTISKVASYNQKLQQFLKRAANSEPSSKVALFKQLETLKEQCFDDVWKAEELLKNLSDTNDPLERLRRRKVSEDLQTTVFTFRSLLEEWKKLETNQTNTRDSVFPVVSKVSRQVTEKSEDEEPSHEEAIQKPDETTRLQPNKQQLQVQKQVSYDSTTTEFLRERHEAIREIETSISEVNSIFKDLAIMIKEQGIQVEELGSNVENAVVQTESAVEQLTKAKIRRSVSIFILSSAILILVS